MRLPADLPSGRVPAVALLIALVAPLIGCEPGDPVYPYGVRELAIVADSDTLRPGRTTLLRAVATGINGELVDAPITWRSMTPNTLEVDASGEVFARTPGIGVVRASIGGLVTDRTLQLVNPPAVAFNIALDTVLLTLPGGWVAPGVTPLDSFGGPVDGETLTWESDAPRIASVSPAGAISPVAVGRTTVTVSLDGVSKALPVIVSPASLPDAPVVDSVVPRSITPGLPFTVYGQRLVSPGQPAELGVDGFPAQALTVTSTAVTAMLPSTTTACVPSGDAAVQVKTSSGYGAAPVRIQLAPRRTLAVGEAALLLTAATAGCVELPATGRYLLTVVNAGRALGAGDLDVTVDLRTGREAEATLFYAQAPRVTMATSAATSAAAHIRVLERAVAFQPATASAPRIAALQVPPTGGIAALRVPDLDDSRLCVGYRPIHARTVYDGTHVAILEDTVSTVGGVSALTRQMDDAIVAIGSEVDTLIWPLIERFGDPLVMDDRLDANGKVVLVLTPSLNAMQDGAVMGAVVTCDYFPRAAAPSSNVGEMLYLQVPDLVAHPSANDALRVWRAAVRGTIAHELKHVVGFAERIARGQPLEESWLEEATARHAEELFTRALTGLGASADAGYSAIRCEALAALGDGGCADTPAMMRPTLVGLYGFVASSSTRSPLGGIDAGDVSYYGSAWSLLRWAMDHAALDEAAFTRALTLGGQSGIANLEASAGRSWDELLTRWSLATLTDGRVGLESADPLLTFRGWQLGALFEGFCDDLGGCGGGDPAATFGRAHPAQPMVLDAARRVRIPALVPGGFAAFDLTPATAGTTRLLHLRGADGVALPTLRLALLRVE